MRCWFYKVVSVAAGRTALLTQTQNSSGSGPLLSSSSWAKNSLNIPKPSISVAYLTQGGVCVYIYTPLYKHTFIYIGVNIYTYIYIYPYITYNIQYIIHIYLYVFYISVYILVTPTVQFGCLWTPCFYDKPRWSLRATSPLPARFGGISEQGGFRDWGSAPKST